jgi:hypothetical protein
MISISLIGDESLTNVLRALTVYTIIKNKNEYLSILRRELSASSMINIDEQVMRQFNSILLEAKKDKTWCNEYHLLAISTFLNSDIYIYSTFFNRTTGILYQNANSVEDLQNFFNQGHRTGAHLIYRPLNCLLSENNQAPIFGYFSSIRRHYAAVIPKSQQPPIFKPTNCIISV